LQKYDTKISVAKTKAMGVCGKNIRVKIEIEGIIINQVPKINFLGNVISETKQAI
jgi:hypothetical protein